MKITALILSLGLFSSPAFAGVLVLNCISDSGLTFSVATDVDSAPLGTASDFAQSTKFKNDMGTLSRETVEVKGEYKIANDSKGHVKKITIASEKAPFRTWVASVKKIRAGIMPMQKTYEGRVVEKIAGAAGWDEVGTATFTCVDSM